MKGMGGFKLAYYINDLTKKYKDLVVLNKFNLEIPDNGILCLNGPSGCGKTTLLSIIAGLVIPDCGELEGFQNKKISYVFQEDRLLPWLTAYENVECVMNTKCKYAPDYFLNLVKLGDSKHKYPGELSGGMQRRVAIARALAFEGDIFILDEPFKGLDDLLKIDIMNIIKKMSDEKLVLLITHDIEEAMYLATKIINVSGPPLKIINEG